jgi:hypothetical protein
MDQTDDKIIASSMSNFGESISGTRSYENEVCPASQLNQANMRYVCLVTHDRRCVLQYAGSGLQYQTIPICVFSDSTFVRSENEVAHLPFVLVYPDVDSGILGFKLMAVEEMKGTLRRDYLYFNVRVLIR